MLIFTGLAQAGTWYKSPIDLVYPLANGDFMIRFVESNPICTNPNGFHRIYVGSYGVTLEGSNKIFAAALAASAQGVEVEASVDIEGDQCYINRLKIFR